MFDVNEALESELPLELRSRVQQGDVQSGGFSTMVTASADYARNRRRLQLAGTALTAFRYYGGLNEVAPVTHSAGLGASISLPGQGNLHIAQTAAYSPSYLYQLLPTGGLPAPMESIPANPDFRIEATDSYSYDSRAALAFGSARRTRVTTTAEYSRTDFQHQIVARPNLRTFATGAKVSRGMSRNGGVSVEYQYRTGEFGFGGLTKEHRLTLGAEYSRALTVSRRATFQLNVSPATLELPESALDRIAPASDTNAAAEQVAAVVDRQLYRLQADAAVEYPFRRNWLLTGNYRRGLEYLAVLTEPVFSNGAGLQLTGVITRRVDVSAAAAHATGESAINRNGQHLDTSNAEVRFRYALKRSLAFYSEYQYYYFDWHGQTGLLSSLPGIFEQHRIRVGLALFVEPLSR
jgi:predicted porin